MSRAETAPASLNASDRKDFVAAQAAGYLTLWSMPQRFDLWEAWLAHCKARETACVAVAPMMSDEDGEFGMVVLPSDPITAPMLADLEALGTECSPCAGCDLCAGYRSHDPLASHEFYLCRVPRPMLDAVSASLTTILERHGTAASATVCFAKGTSVLREKAEWARLSAGERNDFFRARCDGYLTISGGASWENLGREWKRFCEQNRIPCAVVHWRLPTESERVDMAISLSNFPYSEEAGAAFDALRARRALDGSSASGRTGFHLRHVPRSAVESTAREVVAIVRRHQIPSATISVEPAVRSAVSTATAQVSS